jgi:hypothetical protein
MRRTPNVFPESLPAERGIGWHVQPHLADGSRAAWTDIKKRQMSVPLDSSVASRNIRAHELAHASWTPARSPTSVCRRAGISFEALQRAEDCRIGYGLIDSGVTDYASGTLTDDDLARLEADGHRLLDEHGKALLVALARKLSFQVVSMVMTEDKDRILDLADRLGGEPLRAIVENVAEIAETTLFPGGHWRYTVRRRKRSPVVVPFRRAVLLALVLDRLFPPDGAPPRRPPTPKQGERLWGRLTIEEPPRSTVARLARLRTVRRSCDEGTHLRRLDRLLVDGRVFSTKRHLVGGTVLIDGSGSMGWSREDILRCVEVAPAATVAVYSGHGDKGALRIVAKDGRMVAPDLVASPCGLGNIVDGPALEWLSRQTEPRIWISDAAVTGVNEVQSPLLVAEVHRTLLAGRITRLDHLTEAAAHFARTGRRTR